MSNCSEPTSSLSILAIVAASGKRLLLTPTNYRARAGGESRRLPSCQAPRAATDRRASLSRALSASARDGEMESLGDVSSASRYQTNGTLQAPLIPQADLQNEFYMVVSAPSGNRCGFHRGRIVSPGNSYVWICHVVFTRGVFVIGCMSSKRVLNTSINPEC